MMEEYVSIETLPFSPLLACGPEEAAKGPLHLLAAGPLPPPTQLSLVPYCFLMVEHREHSLSRGQLQC